MSDFIQDYLNLLIYQYRNKPNAEAEITSIIGHFEDIYDLYNSFEAEFNLDTATGKQLDIIGRIVGLNRSVPLVVAKKYFGFINKNSTSYSFGKAPFLNGNEETYTDLQLNDFDFRFFLRAKIAKNFANSDILSINEIVGFLFNDEAFVTDNEDMTLNLYIEESVDVERVRIIQQLDLLPKPQGVRYNTFRQYTEGRTFGFINKNSESRKFGEGKFAKGII